MKPSTLISLGLLGASLFSFAAPAQTGALSSTPIESTLGFQQAAPPAPTELQVQFVGYRDSRCPSNVACAVAGEAWAFFWLSGDKVRPQVISLPWSGGEPNWRNAVRVGSYELVLRSLEPRPILDGMVNPSLYKAVVALRKR